jgi:hypothetical protein
MCRDFAKRGRLRNMVSEENDFALQLRAKVKRILEIGRECADLPVLDPRPADEMLYDENGLPN